MNKKDLKIQIDNDIKTNGTQSITGSKLNNILNEMVDPVSFTVNTIEDLRLSIANDGDIITLLGYYEAGDKEPLNYKYTSTQGVDDGGAVINTGNGSWIAVFSDSVNVAHYGVFPNLTDCYESLNRLFNSIKNNRIQFNNGVYNVRTNAKLELRAMYGVGINNINSTISFHNKDSGFIITMPESGIPSLGTLSNIVITGNGVCDNLITLERATEGYYNKVYFHGALNSVFYISEALDICHFTDCVYSFCENVFYTTDDADSFNSLNSVHLIGGNYYNVNKFINTKTGGNVKITQAWFEKTNQIIYERGVCNGSNINISKSNIVKSPKVDDFTRDDTAPLFELSEKSQSIITYDDNTLSSYVAHKFIKVNKHGDGNISTKNIRIQYSLINGGYLEDLFYCESGINNLYLVQFYFNYNIPDFSYSWRNSIQTVITTGTTLISENLGKTINFRIGDVNQSKLNFDTWNNKFYVTDEFVIEKRYIQDTNANYTSARPTVNATGQMFFDLTLSKPIWWNGTNWIDATGTTV